ncbi:AAA family ATPase [Limimaricola variabilis]|uniref:AAA family ATPase n=1 Tax=Limimaricola TaxID=2211638 RepID=UPI002AC929B4|nr:AAA family ATPase [Limimaricola variabilis]WPY96910.1 AAA family ATPase [Limimaricola variabilis]
MQLSTFRIMNYRSIQDSGEISAFRITALLGRNESGKSNLLRALTHVNPVGGLQPLNGVKDFPRNRRLEQCSEDTPVAVTTWILDKHEQDHISKIWPCARPSEPIKITRFYGAKRTIFVPRDDLPFEKDAIEKAVQKIGASVKAAATRVEDAAAKSVLEAAADTFKAAAAPQEDPQAWATAALAAIDILQTELAKADEEFTDKQEEVLTSLRKNAQAIAGDEKAHATARSWLMEHLPLFVYFDDYPEIPGHQNIPAYLKRKAEGTANTADENFEKLCKVAGLDPTRLQEIQKSDTEQRNQLANRASSVVSGELQKRWTDRKVKVRFNLDGDDLHTFVSDTAKSFDVDVNLNERSRGFQWFFSFYTAFAADTDNGDKDTAILLLDEPGLYLHAKSQGDLLIHLEDDFDNQILYTTHSPFMVPTKHLDWVRTVNIAETDGTTVTNNPSGDRKTLFPLQAALGYDLAQSLFVGGSNLIVEGVTDFWILSAVSEYLASQGRQSLDESLTITPAGGAQKIPYMAALLASENLNVLVLLDHEKDALSTREDLLKTKVLRENNILSIGDAFEEDVRPKDADIEDLLDALIYEKLVRDSHAPEIGKKKLTVNDRIPRLAKRMEQALKGVDVEFSKTRPARLFLEKIGQSPADVLTPDALARFERLIVAINEKLARHIARDARAFQ